MDYNMVWYVEHPQSLKGNWTSLDEMVHSRSKIRVKKQAEKITRLPIWVVSY